ncbi:MAG: hypothetical protein ACI8ZM_003868 [Crocinitomix sp.]|jgi:hypothetical protein
MYKALLRLFILPAIILFNSCSNPSENNSPKENKTQSEGEIVYNENVTIIDGHLPENLSDSIWVFYHEVSDEMDIVMNTHDLFLNCSNNDENSPINCDSLIIAVTAGIEKINNMEQPGNSPEIYVQHSIEVMNDFAEMLASFKEHEYLLSTKVKVDWTGQEVKYWDDFLQGPFDSNFELWNTWRWDAGSDYIESNEEYVGPQ